MLLGKKGFVSKVAITPSDSFVRTKSAPMGWELKTPCNFGDNTLISGQHAVENLGLGELGFEELLGKQVPGDSIRDGLNCKNAGAELIIPFTATQSVFSREEDSPSKFSSSVVDSISQDSALIDLKLGMLNDQIDANISKFSHGISIVSSCQSLTPQKRMQLSGVNSHTAFCQVYGCGKDLGSSKGYHKRHKVCEVHSKTAKVIVKGIEQRFCQQCSRFHLLAEFDDGKRSCRRRLAGHNERRRKPQLPGRLHQSFGGFAGGKLLGTTVPATSFVWQEIFPSALLHPERDGTSDRFRHKKDQHGTSYSPLFTNPMGRLLHSKSTFPSNNFEESFPSFQDNGANTRTGSIFCENSRRYPHDSGDMNSAMHSLSYDISLGSEDLTVFDTGSTIHKISGITDSGCALSLLSSRLQNTSGHVSGISMTLDMPSICQHASPMSERFIGANSKAESVGLSSQFSTSKMNSTEGSHFAPILTSDSSDAMNYEITGGAFKGSDFVNARDHFLGQGWSTIDLLQLSSQLQRVEHQRRSIQSRQESDAFCRP